jgi:hypothetical protein
MGSKHQGYAALLRPSSTTIDNISWKYKVLLAVQEYVVAECREITGGCIQIDMEAIAKKLNIREHLFETILGQIDEESNAINISGKSIYANVDVLNLFIREMSKDIEEAKKTEQLQFQKELREKWSFRVAIFGCFFGLIGTCLSIYNFFDKSSIPNNIITKEGRVEGQASTNNDIILKGKQDNPQGKDK